MENEINIAELLRNCPSGMELDSPVWNNIVFEKIDRGNIVILRKSTNSKVYLSQYGEVNSIDGKCIIFPKGKTTWEGFVPPCNFKDGDIISDGNYIAIFYKIGTPCHCISPNIVYYHCYYSQKFCIFKNELDYGIGVSTAFKYATEEEKEKLFQAIRDNGYTWNSETKTLEKLIKPKFKVGDRIKVIDKTYQYVIKGITDTHYTLEEVENKFQYIESIIEDKNWKLVSNKFDINTLVSFESKVLVRDTNKEKWKSNFWGFYDSDNAMNYPYECCGASFAQCIPYEGNEHLLSTTNDCSEYYKNWKE